MAIFQDLKDRGLIAQCTHEEKVQDLLDNQKGVPFYIGFDATADSLHVGHFLQLVVMSRMQKAGHKADCTDWRCDHDDWRPDRQNGYA